MLEDENVTGAVLEFSQIKKKTREKMDFKSLSECRSGLYGANVKCETVPDCGASEGEGSLSKSLSECR